MLTIPLLLWFTHDPFEDLLIGAMKAAHTFSDADTIEKYDKIIFFKANSFLTTYHSIFEVHSVSLEMLIHPSKPDMYVLRHLDHKDMA